jgi:hypothetical protein
LVVSVAFVVTLEAEMQDLMPDLMKLARTAAEAVRNAETSTADGFTPAARELERRRQTVADRLKADPMLRYAFDVQGASPGPGAPAPVSVMLGLRDRGGRIITGLMAVPADRWPGMAMFCAFWRDAAKPN